MGLRSWWLYAQNQTLVTGWIAPSSRLYDDGDLPHLPVLAHCSRFCRNRSFSENRSLTPTAELAEVGIGTRLRDPERTAHIQMSESVKSVSLANGSASRAPFWIQFSPSALQCFSLKFTDMFIHVNIWLCVNFFNSFFKQEPDRKQNKKKPFSGKNFQVSSFCLEEISQINSLIRCRLPRKKVAEFYY